ncbi:MAG: ribbon-helix-helix domain-containing protein [Kiloniellales bacterium]
MSRIHTGLGQEDCACVARSLRLAGYATSIRMEVAFWNILDEIAAAEGTTTARYLAALYETALARDGEIPNFTALLRVTCTRYLRDSLPARDRGARGQAARIMEPAAAE